MIESIKALYFKTPIAIVGMGKSGKSALSLLELAEYSPDVFDSKTADGWHYLDLEDKHLFDSYQTLVVSPGIDRRKAAIREFQGDVINDVEIFAGLVNRPVIGVTGSNGKSTVVTMIAEAMSSQGMNVRLCGNIGRPVLDAYLDEPEKTDVYVVELSSYQLELSPSLRLKVGAILNVTPDHLNRYDSFSDYADAKANLVRQSQMPIINADDAICKKLIPLVRQSILFGNGQDNCIENKTIYVDKKPILNVEDLKVHGRKNQENVLVTLLVLFVLGMDLEKSVDALLNFPGLDHRVKEIHNENDIIWLDDSKATNIGATEAALAGLVRPTWIIVGGVGKGQNFNLLANLIHRNNMRGVLLIGLENEDMKYAFELNDVDFIECITMKKAVAYAKAHAVPGEQVLLSPATASFDQYNGYEQRGDDFIHEVKHSES